MTEKDPTATLADRLAIRFRVRGGTLAEVQSAAGRRIPRRIRADLATLVEAERLKADPRLARALDLRRTDRAARNLKRYLDSQGILASRWGRVLDRVALVAFVVVAAAIAGFFIALDRGYFG